VIGCHDRLRNDLHLLGGALNCDKSDCQTVHGVTVTSFCIQ